MLVDSAYHPTVWAMGASGALLLVQLIVADISAIKAGHKAGTPIPVDFKRFMFRAARAHANTNESISAFIVLAITGLLSSASPLWLNTLAWAYIACRTAHMVSYYANKRIPRSTAFGISLLVLLGMCITNIIAWVSP